MKKIDGLAQGGGTNLEQGILKSTAMFSNSDLHSAEVERRVMFLTDMCPNVGSHDGKSLLVRCSRQSAQHRMTACNGCADTTIVVPFR